MVSSIYRYSPGQLFRKHYDDSVTINGTTSEWTLLIYLSGVEDGVEGGETVFDLQQGKKVTKEFVVGLNRGTVLLHRHGHECLLREFCIFMSYFELGSCLLFAHLDEGREVKKGVKWVLRSDVLFA